LSKPTSEEVCEQLSSEEARVEEEKPGFEELEEPMQVTMTKVRRYVTCQNCGKKRSVIVPVKGSGEEQGAASWHEDDYRAVSCPKCDSTFKVTPVTPDEIVPEKSPSPRRRFPWAAAGVVLGLPAGAAILWAWQKIAPIVDKLGSLLGD
jgi:DNA-directed RNA polymerase subunit RPC12/RpoP